MSDEVILAILGAIGAIGTLAGNLAVTWRTKVATEQATKAVAANTVATDAGQKLTTEVAARAEENQRLLREFMVEFRRLAAVDRDTSLAIQFDRIWQAREKVFLARHDEVTELLHEVLARVADGHVAAVARSTPEAHTMPVMPDLRTTPPNEKTP